MYLYGDAVNWCVRIVVGVESCVSASLKSAAQFMGISEVGSECDDALEVAPPPCFKDVVPRYVPKLPHLKRRDHFG
jgi:hypothetical protein